MEGVETIEYDISGQICPSTLLIALREINRNIAELNSGRVRLVFKTDNRDCINTIPEAVSNMGLNVAVSKDGPSYTIVVSGS